MTLNFRLLLGLCFVIIFLGCRKNSLNIDQDIFIPNNVLRITTKAASNADPSENAIRTLRLFVFDAKNGDMLINKLFQTADADFSSPSDTYTYFLKDNDGNYTISELIRKTDIKVLMVANEMTPFNAVNYTLDQVKGAVLNYRSMYSSNGTTDIVIDANNTTSNKGSIPMFAESDTISHGNWDAGSGKVVSLKMIRCLSKITVQIRSGLINDPDFAVGDELIIESASIGRMAMNCFVADLKLDYSAAFTYTKTVNFKNQITINHNNTTPGVTDKLIFYIPEFNISQNQLANSQYCYIQINALYKSASSGSIHTSYRIPLGDGVSKLYSQIPSGIDDLTGTDLSISRNNQYNFDATISSKGILEALKVNVSIKDWEKTIEVDGDINTPLINISNIDVKMSSSKVRVHFWTNQPQPYIELKGLKNETTEYNVNDIFKNISAPKGTTTSNFQLFPNTSSQYYPYNGYIDIEFNDKSLYIGDSDKYSIVLRAGNLTRSIIMEANPVVAQVLFDPNGGWTMVGRVITVNIRLREVGLDENIGDKTLSIANPSSSINAPTGKVFGGWLYVRNGSSFVQTAPSNMLNVTARGYATTVYAYWK